MIIMRNLKKETLVERILVNAYTWQHIPSKSYNVEWLNDRFQSAFEYEQKQIDIKKREIRDHKQSLKKWKELYAEYTKNKNQFVIKYYKSLRKKLIKRASKYSHYRDVVILLDELVNKYGS